ncbi:hypothetical protein GWK36_09350 [Caldichromatium japonicum]|uniref:Uncharacterized protein n=1 Tax=Caldichromatium japonicum TaxID=2699430 RepID=A0A6G7VDX0_9GAMM|nr:hypothetical protein [Caldichromatium japonicum]QIK38152.1 hypothetical protein GWK36_09350 [Caldichromatium japonicum]
MSDPAPYNISLSPRPFPLAPQSRPLRLYPGASGELRVHWRLSGDLLMHYRPYFPAADGPLTAVLRLWHLHADGPADLCAERDLSLMRFGGAGELAFAVGDAPGPFQAELGLINPQGGWLALVRSNRLLHAQSIGLEGLGPPPPRLEPLASPVIPPAPEPMSGRDPMEAEAAQPVPAQDRPRVQPAAPGQGRVPITGYGSVRLATPGPVIEAELCIRGWGPPETEINLFGHRYRLGPGGRFQFSIRLDDPELIGQILARHPPPGGWQ